VVDVDQYVLPSTLDPEALFGSGNSLILSDVMNQITITQNTLLNNIGSISATQASQESTVEGFAIQLSNLIINIDYCAVFRFKSTGTYIDESEKDSATNHGFAVYEELPSSYRYIVTKGAKLIRDDVQRQYVLPFTATTATMYLAFAFGGFKDGVSSQFAISELKIVRPFNSVTLVRSFVNPPYFYYGLEDPPNNNFGEENDTYMALILSPEVLAVPQLTATTDSVITGQNYKRENAYHLFDNNNTTFYSTADKKYENMWFGYDFGVGNEVVIIGAMIYPRGYYDSLQIGAFEIQGSNNLVEWTTLYSGEFPNSTAYVKKNYVYFDNSIAYRAYRIYAPSKPTGSITFTLFELNFIVSSSKKYIINNYYIKHSGGWSLGTVG
jgi:hypothetical protein